ncbi:MAG TPA: MarR family transcriptional regulator [Rhizomicrobium sp.]|nr:MarR family transcriptional regulator [Rhizomicrobium sp.]
MSLGATEPDPFDVADRIHSASIRLLRHVRKADLAAGISAPQLSALAVLVFNGPQTMTQLASAEQVRLPTVSKLVAELESRALVVRSADPSDRRVSRIFPTKKGRVLLEESRRRRLSRLVESLNRLSKPQLSALAAAADTVFTVALHGFAEEKPSKIAGPDQ